MSDLTYFINNELYPRLFERVDSVFPVMSFTRYRSGWASQNKLNGECSHDNRKDKSVITSKLPNRVIEQGGESKDLITFFKEQNNYSSDIEAIKALCNLLGLTLPNMENSESYRAYKDKQDKLEASAERMKQALYSPDGAQTLNYLKNERGYDDEFIKDANFGFCSIAEANTLRPLLTYYDDKGYKHTLHSDVGVFNLLSIPYRTGGRIVGFVFRAIDQTAKIRYIDAFISASASNRFHLFGLTGLKLTGNKDKDKDITIVEGEIDALRGQHSGVDNIVAASGGELSSEALQEAKKRGVKRITILFDTEETEEKQQATNKKIEKAIEAIYAVGLAPFVATLPTDGGKCDVDSYLQNHTGQELQAVIDKAITGALFLCRKITYEAIKRQGGDGDSTYKDFHALKSEIIELANSKYISPTDRDTIFTHFQEVTGEYITKESLQEEADRLKGIADFQKQKNDTLNTIKEAYSLVNGTEADGVAKALNLLQEKVKPLQEISKEAELAKYLVSPSIEENLKRFRERPTGIKTNYYFGEGKRRTPLILNSGALTFVCAPTSHGKSTMLRNLAVQLIKDDTDEIVLYFSYEEPYYEVCENLLNTYIGKPLNNGNWNKNNINVIIDYYKGSTKYLNQDAKEMFFAKEKEFTQRLSTNGNLRVYAEDFSVEKLVDIIRLNAKNKKIKAVFIDYVQRIHKANSNRQARYDELADITDSLMNCAIETKLPVILAAQVVRSCPSPIDMDVQMLSDSSNIEKSANTILMLWNSAVKARSDNSYFAKKSGEELTPEAQRLDIRGFHIGQNGTMYAKLAKNRGGARNIDAILSFDGNTGVIAQTDYTPPTEEEQTSLNFEDAQKPKKNTLPF